MFWLLQVSTEQSVVHYRKHNRQHRNMTPSQKGDSNDIYVCLQIKIQLSSHVKFSWLKYCIVSLFTENECYINYVFFSHIQWILASKLQLVSWCKPTVVKPINSHNYSLMEIITAQSAYFTTNITCWTCTKIQSIYPITLIFWGSFSIYMSLITWKINLALLITYLYLCEYSLYLDLHKEIICHQYTQYVFLKNTRVLM